MMVIFTDQSDKNALKKTRWILDAFANRIGTDTWQTVITEDGLRMVRNLLRRHATKSMSVSCRWIRSRTRSQLLWIVGDRNRFNKEGYVPVNSTQKDEMHNAWENNWQYLPEIKSLTAVAALLHDWGKANDAFQKLLQGKKGQELYRHEWLSCKLLESLVCLSGNSLDDGWLLWLQKGDFPEKKLIKWVNENAGKPFSVMPPLASLICWLILSHHRLPKLDDEASKRYKCTEITVIPQLLAQISADWGYIKGEKATIKFSQGLMISAAWQKMLKKWCGRLLEQKDELHGLWTKNNVRLLLVYSRVCLMLADYTVSSSDKDESWQEKSLIYANTQKQQMKQYLAEHLVRVAEQATAIAHRLPKFAEGMNKAEDMTTLRKKSPAAFAWQDKAVGKIRDVQQQQAKTERKQGGWFVINMAGTGCGKTFANAKIMQAISPDGKSLRYSLLLGLRSLTLQTGQEYRARIGMDASEMAVLVGTAAVKDLYEEAESWDDTSDTACMNELLPGEVSADFPQEDKFLQVVLASSRSAAGKNRDLLYAPVLVATIDHLMPASESVRGGRHILPLLRMMSADIVIDEIDDFAGADLVAIARLVHTAGLLGKNVILSSATIPPDLAEGLFSAYVSGRTEFARFFGCHNELNCVWTNEFQTKIHSFADSEKDKILTVYRRLHRDFSLRHKDKLDLQPVKRYGWIVECKQLLDLTEGERLRGYFQVMQDAILRLHARYAVKDKRTGKNVSLGVVRLAHINPCVWAAKYLLKSTWPEDCAPRIMVYHSRQTALLRSMQEKYLDKILKRKEQDMSEVDFTDTVMRRHIDGTKAQNIIFILVATPVEELGRDHDFDWTVMEPSSYRSVIQLAGRIRRHRHAINKSDLGNIAIMQYNIEALTTRKKIVFAMPGFECRQYLLSSHDMNCLVDTQQLADGINAAPRIVRPEKLHPHDKMIHLEHQVLSDFRDLTFHGAGYIHGWQEEAWWLTALPQQFNKFREGKQEIELCLWDKEDSGLAFYEQSSQSKEWVKRETAYGIIHEQIEEGERFWVERNYQQALASYLAGKEGREAALRVGALTISGPADWRYADQFGMYKPYKG